MPGSTHALESPYTLRRLPEGLESVEGLPLRARIAEAEILAQLEALRYALHTASSLVEAHSQNVGHGQLDIDAIVLERLERHCCEAEKFRAKLTYPADPAPWTPTLQADDIRAFGALLATMLGPAAEPQRADPLRRIAADCASGRFRTMPKVLRRLEQYVERQAFGKPSLAGWLGAFASDALAVGAAFHRDPAIALLVWLVYDTGTRFAVQRTLGERLWSLPPDHSPKNLLFRLVLFAGLACTLWWVS